MNVGVGKSYTYTVVLERDLEAGGFVVSVPTFPGLVTEGDTVENSLEMAREAILAYIESLAKDNLPIPEERESVASPITVELPAGI
jgi:antitoxin HicB